MPNRSRAAASMSTQVAIDGEMHGNTVGVSFPAGHQAAGTVRHEATSAAARGSSTAP